jgi:hypothetical protein
MNIVSKQEYNNFIGKYEYSNKLINGHNVIACESYDKQGNFIASALYERIAGIVSKTYRIKN